MSRLLSGFAVLVMTTALGACANDSGATTTQEFTDCVRDRTGGSVADADRAVLDLCEELER